MRSIYGFDEIPNSFIIKIPVGDTNFCQIVDSLTAVYGPPLVSGWYISNSRMDTDNWVVLLRGQPDKKFTRLCLEYQCEIVESNNDIYR